jgi:Tfp pilus assembly protein PilO
VRLQSATYRAHKEGRVERLEIALPLAGSYAQIRDFAARALAEIPAASLDQLSIKRESRGDAQLHAELRLTIHRVKS